MGKCIILFGIWLFCGGLISVLDNVAKWNKEENNCSKETVRKQRIASLILFILWIIAGALLIIKTLVGCL